MIPKEILFEVESLNEGLIPIFQSKLSMIISDKVDSLKKTFPILGVRNLLR